MPAPTLNADVSFNGGTQPFTVLSSIQATSDPITYSQSGLTSGTNTLGGSNTLDNSNALDTVDKISGAQYAFEATGGFYTSETFNTIKQEGQSMVQTYDVTGAVEVMMSVDVFNSYIQKGIQGFYHSATDMLDSDTFTMTANQFIRALNCEQPTRNGNPDSTFAPWLGKTQLDGSITMNAVFDTPPPDTAPDASAYNANNFKNIQSVGKLSTLYSDFATYVHTYFGMQSSANTSPTQGVQNQSTQNPIDGFATLFQADYQFDPNGGIFGPEQLYGLIMGTTASADANDGSYNVGLGGSFTLNNITQLLRDAVSSNPFGNRPTGMMSDNVTPYNWGVTDGFLSGDVIFLNGVADGSTTNGLKVTMQLVIDNEAYAVNTTMNSGADPTYAGKSGYPGSMDSTFDASSSSVGTTSGTSGANAGSATTTQTNPTNFASSTVMQTVNNQLQTTTCLIKREVVAPLLIRMVSSDYLYGGAKNASGTPSSSSYDDKLTPFGTTRQVFDKSYQTSTTVATSSDQTPA